MRQWILAMLGISALLLIRNMAKTISQMILQGKKNVLVETIYENHPQKIKMEKYADSFEKLSDSFYRMSQAASGSQIAIAEQMEEVSHMLRNMADEFYDICCLGGMEFESLKNAMKKNRILLKQAWKIVSPGGSERIIVNVRTKGRQCIPVKTVTDVLEQVFQRRLMPSAECRSIINENETMVRYSEATHFQAFYGVAKVARDGSVISGDSYGCLADKEGEFVLCLADGMGSGTHACRESEKVVDLMEQFLDSGFSKETAAKMINSALVLQQNGDMFSTVDVCAMNLYTGVCEFLKAGAATTFIKRDDWVETITSTSLAVGLLQETDFEILTRKLYPGDYVVMVTDGVLDALPLDQEEEAMKEIILSVNKRNPREMGRWILEKILQDNGNRAMDDMTVLVAGLWDK